MKKTDRILVIGTCGQIGRELTAALSQQHGPENVIAADIHPHRPDLEKYLCLDVLNHRQIEMTVKQSGVTQIYLLAAMLSARGEQNPDMAWKLNVNSLLSVLRIAQEQQLDKVFWPSSIAVFGPGSPRHNCPQQTRIEPHTVYGISKRAGEYWCNYYFEKYGVDVRSLRFPGLISGKMPAGGGITDYAVDIFHSALETGRYTCFLSEDNCLPMLYMPDAVRAILELMDAPKEKITIRTAYNLAGMSFAPCDLAAEIKKHMPEFKIAYEPDYRNAIANSWPASIRDEQARKDWGWQPAYELKDMTRELLNQLRKPKEIGVPVSGTMQHDYPDFPSDN